MREALVFLENLPPVLTYLVLGAGAAVENLVPPVPADTFVLLGSFVATRGRATLTAVFLVTWIANVSSAFAVYLAAHRYGPQFFQSGLGARILDPTQMDKIGRFYDRWGVAAIFVTRFLPGLRAIVPVFAGVTRQRAFAVGAPIVIASGIWYGILVLLGRLAADNFEQILAAFSTMNRGLLAVTIVLAVGAILWWRGTRGRGPSQKGQGEP
ncbi:MAG: DedA family protein [Longimicrobiales bacterium]